jgi:hypothetical protein
MTEESSNIVKIDGKDRRPWSVASRETLLRAAIVPFSLFATLFIVVALLEHRPEIRFLISRVQFPSGRRMQQCCD